MTVTVVSSPPATPGQINGPITLCPGQTNTYFINPVTNATGYEWATTGGLIINNGQGTTSVSITAPPGFVSGQIKVRATNCAGKSAYRVLTITGLAPQPVWDFDHANENPTVGVCGGSTWQYELHFNAAITCYVWTAPQGAVITNTANNQTGNPLTVNSSNDDVMITFPAGFTSGVVSVASCNSACGTGIPITLNVRSTPAAPGPISGPVSGLCGTSNKVYSISSVPGATSYIWSFPAGVQVTNTSNSGKTKTVKFLNGFTSGQVCVAAANACGTGPQTCVSITGAPPVPGPITGSSSVCKSQTNLQYSIAAVAGATSYNWSITGGAIITSGQTTRTIRVKFTTQTQPTALLSVTVNNACGTSGPVTKTIVVNLNCKTSGDDESFVAVTGSSLNAYPNPTSGKATVTFNAEQNGNYVIKVIDVLGKTMVFESISAVEGYNMKEIDLTGVAKGMYFVTLQAEGMESQTLRLIVE